MKQFDIEKAKNGAAVCLRDGTPVKILDFDFGGKVVVRFRQIYSSGREEDRLEVLDHGELYMTPVYGYMNVYKNETNKVLFGGVVRATLEECKEAGKVTPTENPKWFCHARVELLDEGEGGEE
jgi:hypothetical protein